MTPGLISPSGTFYTHVSRGSRSLSIEGTETESCRDPKGKKRKEKKTTRKDMKAKPNATYRFKIWQRLGNSEGDFEESFMPVRVKGLASWSKGVDVVGGKSLEKVTVSEVDAMEEG